jgi:hypothetical protein
VKQERNVTTKQTFSNEPFTFQVVVESVVGEVTVDPYGDGPSPREAAFILIARHGDEGRYSFPLEDGKTEHITIERS